MKSSHSVEYGKQGLHSNVGTNWYPVMDKAAYRLNPDALEPEKLFPGATLAHSLKPDATRSLRSKRAKGTLKPLALSRSLSGAQTTSQFQAARSSSQPGTSGKSIQESQLLLESGELSYSEDAGSQLDLSNNDYFKSLLLGENHPKAKKNKSRRAPHVLPKLPARLSPRQQQDYVASQLPEVQVGRPFSAGERSFSPGSTEELSEEQRGKNHILSAVFEGSNELGAGSNELFQPSVTSYTTPMIQELKDSIHHMLLTQATPLGGSTVDAASSQDSLKYAPSRRHSRGPKSPPSPTTTQNRRHLHMNDDIDPSSTPSGRRSPSFRALSRHRTTSTDFSIPDDMSSMLSVNSGVSSQRRTGGKEIIKEYTEKIGQK